MLDGSGYLDLSNSSRYADVSRRVLRRWLKSGGLPSFRHSPRSKILIRPQDIDAFLTKQHTPKPDLNALVADTLRHLRARGGR